MQTTSWTAFKLTAELSPTSHASVVILSSSWCSLVTVSTVFLFSLFCSWVSPSFVPDSWEFGVISWPAIMFTIGKDLSFLSSACWTSIKEYKENDKGISLLGHESLTPHWVLPFLERFLRNTPRSFHDKDEPYQPFTPRSGWYTFCGWYTL